MSCHIRVTSRLPSDASFEEQKRDVEKMQKIIRSFYNEPGGLKDRIEEKERFVKPSEQRRLRKKVERNRALNKKKNGLK